MIPKTATNKHQQAPASNKLQAGHQQACNLYAASTSTTIRVHLEGISTTPTSKQDTSTTIRVHWRVSVPHQHQQATSSKQDTSKPVTYMQQAQVTKKQHKPKFGYKFKISKLDVLP